MRRFSDRLRLLHKLRRLRRQAQDQPTALLLLTTLSLATSSFANELVPDEPASIKSIKVAGEGCSWAPMPSSISEDMRTLKLIFGDFKVELGPDVPAAYSRSKCAMQLRVNVPIGWQFTLGSFRYAGYMDIDEGVRSTLYTDFQFERQAPSPRLSLQKNGPWSGLYVYTDQFGLITSTSTELWSPCDKEPQLTISTSLVMRNFKSNQFPSAEGSFAIDSEELDPEIDLIWRRCSP